MDERKQGITKARRAMHIEALERRREALLVHLQSLPARTGDARESHEMIERRALTWALGELRSTRKSEIECPCGEPWKNDPDLDSAPNTDWVCGRCWMGIDQYGAESEVFAASRKQVRMAIS